MSGEILIESFPVGRLQCNCTLIYDATSLEAIVIDPGDDPPALLKIIKQKKLRVKKLLHTHAHFDHIGGSNRLKKEWDVPMYLHAGDHFLYQHLEDQGRLFGFPVEPPGEIDFDIGDEEIFQICQDHNGISIQAVHTPGHTPGSCSFYMEWQGKPLLLSGDTLFKNSVGRTDLPGGDTALLKRSLRDRIMCLPAETCVIPGHGPHTTLYEESKTNPFL